MAKVRCVTKIIGNLFGTMNVDIKRDVKLASNYLAYYFALFWIKVNLDLGVLTSPPLNSDGG